MSATPPRPLCPPAWPSHVMQGAPTSGSAKELTRPRVGATTGPRKAIGHEHETPCIRLAAALQVA